MALTRNQTSHLVRMGAGVAHTAALFLAMLTICAPGRVDRAQFPAPDRGDHGQAPGLDPAEAVARRLHVDVRRPGTRRRSGARLFPQLADRLDRLDRDRDRCGHGRRLRLRPLPFQGQVGAVPRAYVDAHRAGHRAFAAAVHHLCADRTDRHAPCADPDSMSLSTCLSRSG